MQPLPSSALVAALLLLSGCGEAARQSAHAEDAAARSWLQDHPAAQADELAELKATNPQAYAIVKALLTKRSLGLLNPRHPSASFAAPAQQAEDTPSGAAAFQAFASTGGSLATAAAEAPAEPSAHHDWLNWKPRDSAVEDEAMVNNVLGAVADLKGGRPQKSLLGQGKGTFERTATAEVSSQSTASAPGHEDSDMDALGLGSAAPAAPAKTSMQASPQENPYLSTAGLSNPTVASPPATNLQENPYLNSADLGPAKPKPNLRRDAGDYLASFSWDDESTSKKQPAAAAPAAEVSSGSSVGKVADHRDALLSWLGGGEKDAAPPSRSALTQAAASPADAGSEEARKNPYMNYLN